MVRRRGGGRLGIAALDRVDDGADLRRPTLGRPGAATVVARSTATRAWSPSRIVAHRRVAGAVEEHLVEPVLRLQERSVLDRALALLDRRERRSFNAWICSESR